ncbi:MAG: transposase [Verrucomicrobiales bacterium]|nr:transposase [Verrucomicrobiales bacterium]MCP5527801.1 transposase [Verrucomicrobiales bacterium]
MPRPLRIEFAGAVYHVMNRGDRREAIFRDDADRRRFLDTLGEVCGKTDWQVHAYCLMPNHFHLIVETPQPNLVAGMKWFLGTYTTRFNRRHRLVGHLFAGRYKALLVDASSPGYFRRVCDYVHLNPLRANLLAPGAPLSSYAWSSYPDYLKPPKRRWPWLRVDRLLGEVGVGRDTSGGRQDLEQRMETWRAREAGEQDWSGIRRGWFFGPEKAKEELLARISAAEGTRCYGPERIESAETTAERLVGEELAALGLAGSHLRSLPKGDPAKVRIAARLRRETTVTLAWIARRLEMGKWTYVSNLLRAHRAAGRARSVNSED